MTAFATHRPHDLLWGFTPSLLEAGTPDWVAEVLSQGQPVVVRRAVARVGWVAVGIRGAERHQRQATWMPTSAVTAVITPEQLVAKALSLELEEPALQLLQQLNPLMEALGLAWGVTGGAAYQLATGIRVLHPGSDLDVLIRTPQQFSRAQAATLWMHLERLTCRVDVQLETPLGAVALREWASGTPQVLLKAMDGPRLVTNPWQEEEQV